MNLKPIKNVDGTVVTNPPLASFLFDDTRLAVVWLVVRVLIGYSWVDASLHKLSDPGWMVTGDALKGFWSNIVKIPAAPAKPAITFDWYRSFIQFMLDSGAYTWFAKVVAIGEFTVGVCLIIGAFVGVAAFVGATMNWTFIMAGSASSNGLLFAAAVLLILAWKVAGYYGVDRFLLPRLGTPWHLNISFKRPVTLQSLSK